MSRVQKLTKGMGNRTHGPLGGQADTGTKLVNDIFSRLEPFFNGVLVEMKQFNITDKMAFQHHFDLLNANVQTNIYDKFLDAFHKRIQQGFSQSIHLLQQYPMDENFPKHIKEELDKFDYAKKAILVLFHALTYGASTGCGETIEKIVEERWNTNYLSQLNDMLHLTKSLTTIFSTSRRNGNTETVMPVKTILKYYEDNDNSDTNKSKNPLIPRFAREFKENALKDYEDLRTEYEAGGVHLYLLKSLTFIEKEDYRLYNALIDQISSEIQPLLIKQYIEPSLITVYEKFNEIIEKDVDEEFQAIVSMFDRIGKLGNFATAMETAFIEKCRRRIENEMDKHQSQGSQLVTKAVDVTTLLLEFLDELEHKQQISFKRNEVFRKQLDHAMKSIINDNKLVTVSSQADAYFSKVIPSFLNILLRRGSKLETDKDKVKQLIEKVCRLLNYIPNIDVFQEYYLKAFQERLSQELYESLDLEMYAINQLGSICGKNYATKLNTIYSEYDRRLQVTEKFRAHCNLKKIPLPNFEFVFTTYAHGTDMTAAKVSFNPPQAIRELAQLYDDFQTSELKRRITISPTLSSGVIQFNWMKRPIQITCRYYQMGILMLFNEHKELTFAEIGKLTGLGALIASPLSGIVSKGIFSISTPGSFKPDTVVKFNMSFKPRVTKFSVMAADKTYSEKEDQEKDEKIAEQIDAQRSMVIRAQQVRIMKMRKTMKFQELVNESVENLSAKFNITGRMARREIETLINDQYFKRSESDREILEYLA